MRRGRWYFLLGVVVAWSVVRGVEPAAPGLSNAEVARQTSDPTSELWNLQTIVSGAWTPEEGARRGNVFTLELEPSLAVRLTEGWKVLNIPQLTLATQGTPAGVRVTGLEQCSWLAALSPVGGAEGLSYGAGPYVSFPVTSHGLGARQWQVGPGGVLAWRQEDFIATAIVRMGWALTEREREAGSFQVQYTAQYFFGDGAQAGLGHPVITYDWKGDGTGGWDVPVGVNVGKVFRIGGLPVKVMLEYDFYVMNDSRWEPQHEVRLLILPVVESPQRRPLF